MISLLLLSALTAPLATSHSLVYTNTPMSGGYELREDKTFRITAEGEDLAIVKDDKITFPSKKPEKAFEILWRLYKDKGSCLTWPGYH